MGICQQKSVWLIAHTIMVVDAPTTGGYPKIAAVASNPNGTLVSRKQGNAIIASPDDVSAHAVELAKNGIEFEGQRVMTETLRLHGDHPHAVQNAKRVREMLQETGIETATF